VLDRKAGLPDRRVDLTGQVATSGKLLVDGLDGLLPTSDALIGGRPVLYEVEVAAWLQNSS
jgi:hypothetical protein